MQSAFQNWQNGPGYETSRSGGPWHLTGAALSATTTQGGGFVTFSAPDYLRLPGSLSAEPQKTGVVWLF